MRGEGSETVELDTFQRDQEPLMTSCPTGDQEPDKGNVMSSLEKADKKLDRVRNWKVALINGAIASVIVLFFNLGFVLWAIRRYELEDGHGTIYTGHCEKARRISVWFHLVINVLGTLLLGASNYAMQFLCAPTRADIDRAHGKGAGLDIGVPSVRNRTRISKKCALLWIFLALSSVPLHLVYNSTVFLTMSANSYDVLRANPSLTSLPDDANLTLSSNGFQAQNTMSAYATTFQSTYGNLILITDDVHATEYEAMYYEEVVNGHPVNYCLSEKLPEKCKVQYSLPLAIVVMAFNLVKVAVICYAALTSADTSMPILTSGDAIASFLRTPDETTKGQCMVARERLGTQYGPQVVKYHKLHHRWGSAVSVLQWQICLSSYAISIFFAVIFLAVGLSTASTSDNQDTSRVWKLGLGAADPLTILKGDHWPVSLIANSLIANTPQAIFSVLYFVFNSVFTTMGLSAEWSDYAVHRKGLRVSTTPKGAQRSTYFLSLPSRYGIPVLVLSTLIHWLMSQSLFLVAVHARAGPGAGPHLVRLFTGGHCVSTLGRGRHAFLSGCVGL
ncbi:uncharacterized protein APUU_60032A [Aspergillus puulaauensis]|uniref:DUF6536 domain-containing protein n=1 Tax=Aspergillus puulaauensis TaxID=1220207 RepID=A0A7R7XUD7_9EURO|nr:uncharacterized protein APUU_60032A [Aspergillus puulaauensis]BCS26984.1 hypothetical protein APUU_60032A [Aspergillus puulaauensis]